MGRIINVIIISLCFLITAFGQVKEFSGKQDKATVFKGDTIVITAETAYLINKERAQKLDYQLNELQEIKSMYNKLVGDHNVLLAEIKKAQKYLNKLAKKLQKDGLTSVNKLDEILIDLDTTLDELKNNNGKLSKTNGELKKQINSLQKSVNALKDEAKWIWWNGAMDKVVAFGGGIGVGILIALIL